MATENPSTEALFDHLLRIANINGASIIEREPEEGLGEPLDPEILEEQQGSLDLTPIDNPYRRIAEEIELNSELSSDPNVGVVLLIGAAIFGLMKIITKRRSPAFFEVFEVIGKTLETLASIISNTLLGPFRILSALLPSI